MACHHDPDLASALRTDLFNDRLQIDHEVSIVTNILTNFVHHEQKTEVLALAVNIFFDVSTELSNAEFIGLFTVKPITGSLFTHTENEPEHFYNIVLKEGKAVTGFYPRRTVDFFKLLTEERGLALLFDEAFQLGDLQIISVEAAVVIEHLRKDAKNSSLILCDRTFDVDIEQNGLRRHRDTLDRSRIHHRIIELVCEVVHRSFATDFFVGKKVGKHLQEVRFAASKEAGNPDTDLVRRLINRLRIVVKESAEMSTQLSCDYVLAEFLFQAALVVLCNLDNTVYVTVDVLLEHILKFHLATSVTAN